MFTLPPLPAWDGLHPLVIHFPIALFFIAPVLVVAAIVLPRKLATGFALAALTMMIIGTIFAFVAVSTGEAAGEIAERWQPGVEAAIERHEELAGTARTVFAVLTGVFAVLAITPMFFTKKPVPRLAIGGVYGIFLALYAPGMILLANAAHEGGVLVHEYGVHAMLPASNATPAMAPDYSVAPRTHDDDD